ncbi:uncharacterized protein METZ01_LOCUS406116, partial [marine metagenome]
VSGCSYTDNLFTRDFGFTTWPELLADKLGMECINLGASGQGNEYILSSLMEMMFEKDIGLMIAMWSEFERIDFQLNPERLIRRPEFRWGPGRRGWTSVHMHREQHFQNFHPWKDVVKDAFISNKVGILPVLIERSIRLFYNFQILMEMHKIPYLHLMGTNPCDWEDRKVVIKSFFKSTFMDKINENKFIGWPILSEIGGLNISNILDEIDPEFKELRIDYPIDSHPNEEGHKVIANYLHKKVKEEYDNL